MPKYDPFTKVVDSVFPNAPPPNPDESVTPPVGGSDTSAYWLKRWRQEQARKSIPTTPDIETESTPPTSPITPTSIVSTGIQKLSTGMEWLRQNIDIPFASALLLGASKIPGIHTEYEDYFDAAKARGETNYQALHTAYSQYEIPELAKLALESTNPLWWIIPYGKVAGLVGKGAKAVLGPPARAIAETTIGKGVGRVVSGPVRGIRHIIEESPQTIVGNAIVNSYDVLSGFARSVERAAGKTDSQILSDIAKGTTNPDVLEVLRGNKQWTRTYEDIIKNRDKLNITEKMKLLDNGIPFEDVSTLIGADLQDLYSSSLLKKAKPATPAGRIYNEMFSLWRGTVLWSYNYIQQNAVEDWLRTMIAKANHFLLGSPLIGTKAPKELYPVQLLSQTEIPWTDTLLSGFRNVADKRAYIDSIKKGFDTSLKALDPTSPTYKTEAARLKLSIADLNKSLTDLPYIPASLGRIPATTSTAAAAEQIGSGQLLSPVNSNFEKLFMRIGSMAKISPAISGAVARTPSVLAAKLDLNGLEAVFSDSFYKYRKAFRKITSPEVKAYQEAVEKVADISMRDKLIAAGMDSENASLLLKALHLTTSKKDIIDITNRFMNVFADMDSAIANSPIPNPIKASLGADLRVAILARDSTKIKSIFTGARDNLTNYALESQRDAANVKRVAFMESLSSYPKDIQDAVTNFTKTIDESVKYLKDINIPGLEDAAQKKWWEMRALRTAESVQILQGLIVETAATRFAANKDKTEFFKYLNKAWESHSREFTAVNNTRVPFAQDTHTISKAAHNGAIQTGSKEFKDYILKYPELTTSIRNVPELSQSAFWSNFFTTRDALYSDALKKVAADLGITNLPNPNMVDKIINAQKAAINSIEHEAINISSGVNFLRDKFVGEGDNFIRQRNITYGLINPLPAKIHEAIKKITFKGTGKKATGEAHDIVFNSKSGLLNINPKYLDKLISDAAGGVDPTADFTRKILDAIPMKHSDQLVWEGIEEADKKLIKGVLDRLPTSTSSHISGFRVGKIDPGAVAQYDSISGVVSFSSRDVIIPYVINHEIAHAIIEDDIRHSADMLYRFMDAVGDELKDFKFIKELKNVYNPDALSAIKEMATGKKTMAEIYALKVRARDINEAFARMFNAWIEAGRFKEGSIGKFLSSEFPDSIGPDFIDYISNPSKLLNRNPELYSRYSRNYPIVKGLPLVDKDKYQIVQDIATELNGLVDKYQSQSKALAIADLKAKTAAWKTAQGTFGNYSVQSNLDRFMTRFVPFWYFPSRSVPYYLQTAVNKPWIPMTFHRYEDWTKSKEPDAPPSLLGYFKLPVPDSWPSFTKGVYLNIFRPTFMQQIFGTEQFTSEHLPLPESTLQAFSMVGLGVGPQISQSLEILSAMQRKAGVGPAITRGEPRALIPQERWLQAATGSVGVAGGKGISSPITMLVSNFPGESFNRNIDKELASHNINPKDATDQQKLDAAKMIQARALISVISPVFKYRSESELKYRTDLKATLTELGVTKEAMDTASEQGFSPTLYLNSETRKALTELHPEWEPWRNLSRIMLAPDEKPYWEQTDTFYNRWNQFTTDLDKYLLDMYKAVATGEMSLASWVSEYQDKMANKAAAWKMLQDDKDLPLALIDNTRMDLYRAKFGKAIPPLHPEDMALQAYFDISLSNPKYYKPSEATYDFEQYELDKQAFLDSIPDQNIKDYIARNSIRKNDPIELEYNAGRELRKEYWGIKDGVIEQLNAQELYNNLSKADARTAALLKSNPIYRRVESITSSRRETFRKINPEIDAHLLRFGFVSKALTPQAWAIYDEAQLPAME